VRALRGLLRLGATQGAVPLDVLQAYLAVAAKVAFWSQRPGAPPACPLHLPGAAGARPRLASATRPGAQLLFAWNSRSHTPELLIHGLICPPQCAGIRYYISTQAPMSALTFLHGSQCFDGAWGMHCEGGLAGRSLVQFHVCQIPLGPLLPAAVRFYQLSSYIMWGPPRSATVRPGPLLPAVYALASASALRLFLAVFTSILHCFPGCTPKGC
jgi:hypothetical protein